MSKKILALLLLCIVSIQCRSQSKEKIKLEEIIWMALDSSSTETITINNTEIIGVPIDWKQFPLQNDKTILKRNLRFENCILPEIDLPVKIDTLSFINITVKDKDFRYDGLDFSNSEISFLEFINGEINTIFSSTDWQNPNKSKIDYLVIVNVRLSELVLRDSYLNNISITSTYGTRIVIRSCEIKESISIGFPPDINSSGNSLYLASSSIGTQENEIASGLYGEFKNIIIDSVNFFSDFSLINISIENQMKVSKTTLNKNLLIENLTVPNPESISIKFNQLAGNKLTSVQEKQHYNSKIGFYQITYDHLNGSELMNYDALSKTIKKIGTIQQLKITR
jgi:hypothetical protein